MKMTNKFKTMAQEACGGSDLITDEENKLTTEDICAADALTLDDFDLCTIEDKQVGVVTFTEFPGKYYWGGHALSKMVNSFAEMCGSIGEARAQYANEKEKIVLAFEATKTRSKRDFVRVVVL